MSGDKLNIKKTILLSSGFFASTLAWGVYNAFVPLILEGLVTSTAAIGLIMTFDNLFGAVFQPFFGKMSDRTHTRFGRRMPYILVGIPVCAASFALIPRMTGLWSFLPVVIIFTFTMSVWRSPSVALVMDATPERLRSQAGGFLDFMGGLGGVLAFAGGGLLFGFGGFPLPFLMSAVFMFLALLVVALFTREPGDAYVSKETGGNSGVKLTQTEKKSLALLLISVFCLFASVNVIETFFTLYAVNTLGIDGGAAAITLAVFPLAFITFAVPSGYIGAKAGRRKTILTGLSGMIALFIPIILFPSVWLIRILMVAGGVLWACVSVNALPMVVNFSDAENVGTYVGYYYFFSFASQVISPALFGLMRDIAGHYRILFAYSSVPLVIAAICLIFVSEKQTETF